LPPNLINAMKSIEVIVLNDRKIWENQKEYFD